MSRLKPFESSHRAVPDAEGRVPAGLATAPGDLADELSVDECDMSGEGESSLARGPSIAALKCPLVPSREPAAPPQRLMHQAAH